MCVCFESVRAGRKGNGSALLGMTGTKSQIMIAMITTITAGLQKEFAQKKEKEIWR